jgi:redox-sensing transcriptional repressor
LKAIKIPEKTITRLSIYLRCMDELLEEGIESISSHELAERFGLNSAQVRKDLAYFGQFGVRGIGYYVKNLRQALEKILGLSREWEVALVGLGNLGTALLTYRGFSQRGFRIEAIFDRDPEKVGHNYNGLVVQSMNELIDTVQKKSIRIAMMAVPPVSAQGVADRLVQAGILGILNFAPTQINVPKNVKVKNVDLAVELRTLSFFLVRTLKELV